MGTDKALLEFRGATLLENALRIVRQVANSVAIVGPRHRYEDYGQIVEDIHQDWGPLGGIHAALRATKTDLNVILSVDMPVIDPKFLSWLLDQVHGTDLLVVPEALGRPQPLAAVYRRPLLAVVEQAVKDGQHKPGYLFGLAPTRYVSESELRQAGFAPRLFLNLNTREDYEALLASQDVNPQQEVGIA